MTIKVTIRCVLLHVAILLFTSAFPQNIKTSEIGTYVDSLSKAHQLSAVVVASYKGKIIYEKAFGYAEAEFNLPNQLTTRFCIASVTKSMTRVIALKLAEEGELKLQDKLSKWVRDFPSGNQITVEMLLDHRSGLPHRITKPEEETLPYTPADMLEKAKQASLEFEPGTSESYSSLGYSVLARVLELASGKTYSELLRQYVFQPAGLKNSMDFSSDTIIPCRANEYNLEPFRLVPAPLKDYSFIVGAGSVYSTANDIFLFADAVVNGKYGQAVKRALTDSAGRYRDNGATNAFRCFVLFDNEKVYGFVLLSNVPSGTNDLLVRDIPKILQDQTVSPPKLPHFNFVQLPADKLREYVGAYKFLRFTNHVTMIKSQLISGDSKIFAFGEDHFYRLADFATLTFIRNSSGRIEGLKWEALTATFMGIRQ